MRLLPRMRAALDLQYRFLPKVGPRDWLLDVGCGDGSFLERVVSIGWAAAGVDFDPVAIKNAKKRGLDVRLGGIEVFSDRLAQFSAITMSHVIEHVTDPIATLEKALELLKPSGTLYLDTPNIDSIGYKKFGKHWRGLEVPRHLVLFNWPALKDLLWRLGYVNIKRVVRKDVYPRMASASRALSMGEDPYAIVGPALRDRLAGIVANLRVRTNPSCSEFLTLIASKPGAEK